jgi:hypothetical protein
MDQRGSEYEYLEKIASKSGAPAQIKLQTTSDTQYETTPHFSEICGEIGKTLAVPLDGHRNCSIFSYLSFLNCQKIY